MNTLTTAHQRMDACAPTACPMCGRDFEQADLDEDDIYGDSPAYLDDQVHAAAHCCLWKSYDHATRVRIAERVERGATWTEAIKGDGNAA